MAIFTFVIWTEGLETLGSTTTYFFCKLHSFILKHIMHIIVLRIIYDLMSSITTNMIRISHMLLYFSLLSCNLRNYINIIFLPFDSISFNIMIFPMTICTMHSYCLLNYLMFSELILSYYYVVLTDYLWPLLHKVLFHKPKLLPYAAKKFSLHTCCCYTQIWL
jgi:hypothetical protein